MAKRWTGSTWTVPGLFAPHHSHKCEKAFLSANGPREACRWERGAASPGLVGAAQPHPVEAMAGVREPGDWAGYQEPRHPHGAQRRLLPSRGPHLSEVQLCLLDAALDHFSPPPPLPPLRPPLPPWIMARAPH